MNKPLATFILHAYQPFNQTREVLERIVNNCYRPFFNKLIKEETETKITLNIIGCLIEQLQDNYPDVIELIFKGVSDGQIELMGSAYYHPLLPFLTPEEMSYQIQKNHKLLMEVFSFEPSVFFPPELAISKQVLDVVRSNGYKGIIAPSNLFDNAFGGVIDTNAGKLIVVKRNKDLSNAISFNGYKNDHTLALKDIAAFNVQNNFPVVYAMDLETYGEHMKKYYEFFFKITKAIRTIKFSELIKTYTFNENLIDFRESSWSTSDEDQKKGIAFPLWDHPDNAIHQLQHLHIELLRKARRLGNIKEISDEYASAFYSCQFWWATNWWGPNLIKAGLKRQRQVLEILVEKIDNDTNKNLLLELSDKIIANIERIIKYRSV